MLSQYGSHYMLCTVTEVRLLKGCKAVHQWWLASRAGSVSPNESKIPGSILGENTNAFGVVTGIRHKNLPIKYVMLRAVTTPCERSSNAKQLYSIQPSRLYPLVMIQRHAVSGVRWVPVVVCHSVLATCPGCTRLSPCGSWDRLRPSLQTCTGSVINEYNRQNRPKPTTSCSVLFSAAIIAKQEINVKHIKWKE